MNLWRYFRIQTAAGQREVDFPRFKKHTITRRVYIFCANCRDGECVWNEPGYGYGTWVRIA